MLSKTGRRLSAKGHIISESTFTPWLYCTKTIQRGYAGRSIRKIQSLGSKPLISRKPSAEREPRNSKIPVSESEPPSDSTTPLRRVQSSRDGIPVWKVNVDLPFEDLYASAPPTEAPTGFEDTTITPAESRAFESLFRHKSRRDEAKSRGKRSGLEDPTESALEPESGEDDLETLLASAEELDLGRTSYRQTSDPDRLSQPLRDLSETVRERERELQGQKDRQLRERDIKRRENLDEALKYAVDLDIYRTAEKLRRATKDVRVWAILQETLDRVKALDLESGVYLSRWKPREEGAPEGLYPSAQLPRSNVTRGVDLETLSRSEPSSSDSQTPDEEDTPATAVAGKGGKKKKTAASSKSRNQEDAPPSDEQILPYTLDRNIHRIALHLSRRYPASSLSLSVLPALKALGPTAMALGASTYLYNVHLRELSLQYAHAPGRMVELLVEMEQGAYEPDGITRRILGGYLYQIKQMEDGKHGPGAQALATTPRMKRDIPNVRKWYSIVNKKRERAVLAEARRRAALLEGVEEIQGDGESGSNLVAYA